MFVIKRDSTRQPVFYDKITARNIKLAHDLNVDTTSLSQSVIKGLSSGMSTRDIDRLSCESAIHRSIYEPDYGVLASRIAWNDLHKNTPHSFREVLTLLYNNKNFRGEANPLVSENIYNFAMAHIDVIEKELDFSRDYDYSYFAFKTLEKSYLQRVDGKIVERPQHMIMRVSLGIHGPSTRNGIVSTGDIDRVLSSYREMSMKKFTHASPTLFNASSNRPQNSSCFLLSMPDSMGEDEYDGDVVSKGPVEEVSIPECWKHCSKISKHAGGIGVDITRVRCRGAIISGSGGRSDGIIPLVRVLNEIGRYVNQGGRRKGAIAVYLEPWHPDTPEFLEIRLNGGSEELKARDVFPALWIPDLFFKRLESGGEWSFFCPGSYPELIQLYGEEFENRYIQLEKEGKMVRKMKASELWEKVLKSLDEKGLPYMLSKDSVNRKSNQKNIGTITSSNLCCEIVQYHNPKSIAVCNLASISLPSFVNRETKTFDFTELGRITEMAIENLNLVLDKNYSPVRFCAENNLSYRPIGLGVQGLADVFAILSFPWESEEAKTLNRVIFECIYYHAVKKSSELALTEGSYDGFVGSPASVGILQYDMWNTSPLTSVDNTQTYCIDIPKYDWNSLKQNVKCGLRNSLLIAPMPTASTSQILGNNESFEPFTSNIYARKVIAGDFPLVNPHLYRDLVKIGKWNKENVDKIIKDDGSVQSLDIPQKLKDVYKTVWEIPQKIIIDMAADRGAFIDQTQSMNIHIKRPTPSKLSSMYMYAWKKGLKTLSYYLRSQATVDPVKFNIMEISDPTQRIKDEINKNTKQKDKNEEYICNDEVCMMCSS